MPDEHSKRIGDLEIKVAVLQTDVGHIKAATDRIEASVVEGFRAAQEREDAREKVRTEADTQVAIARWEAVKDPRTQVLIAILVLGLFAPQALPLVAQWTAPAVSGAVAAESP